MRQELIIEKRLQMTHPVLIVGFEGWANGGNVAVGMIDFLKKKLDATPFARIDPDNFYRFDDVRPVVKVADGRLLEVIPPEGVFLAADQQASGAEVILFKAHEPHLRWSGYVENILCLCKELGTQLIISLGGLQDSVVHTDAVISGFASNDPLLERLKRHDVVPARYEGPGSIHSLICREAEAIGIQGVSLWGHCPFYLQGTHLRLLSRMAKVTADLAGFQVETTELEKGWTQLARNIQRFVEGNPELQNVIKEIMKSKKRGAGERRGRPKEQGNVIYLDDFFEPKE